MILTLCLDHQVHLSSLYCKSYNIEMFLYIISAERWAILISNSLIKKINSFLYPVCKLTGAVCNNIQHKHLDVNLAVGASSAIIIHTDLALCVCYPQFKELQDLKYDLITEECD